MDPPSYEEANVLPAVVHPEVLNFPPPPSYENSIHSPTTPPPSYGEAVRVPTDPFPVLIPPNAPTTVSTSHSTELIIHTHTHVGVTPTVTPTQTQQVIVTQPQAGPVALPYLTDFPALTCCPHCNQTVTTKVTFKPGGAAWGLCFIIMLSGLCCGCCLIPFMIPSLQEAHHSCPQCKTQLHIYKRESN